MRKAIQSSTVLKSKGYKDKTSAELEETRILYSNSVQEMTRQIEQAEKYAESLKQEINNSKMLLEKYELKNQELQDRNQLLQSKLENLENSFDLYNEDLEKLETSSLMLERAITIQGKHKQQKPRRSERHTKSCTVFQTLPDQVITLEIIKKKQESHVSQLEKSIDRLKQEKVAMLNTINELEQLKLYLF